MKPIQINMKKYFLVLLFGCFINNQIEAMNQDFSPAYCQKNYDLFDQSALIAAEAFQEADEETQQDMLETHFQYRRIFGALWTITDSAIYAIPFLPAALVLYRYSNLLDKVPMAVGLGSGAALGQLLTYASSEPISKLVSLIDSIKQVYLSQGSKSELDRLEITYVRSKPRIQLELQRVVEKHFVSVRCSPHPGPREHDIKIIETILKLPFENHKIVYDSERIDAVLQGYSPQTTLELKRYCIRHAAASTATAVRKIAAYFYGEPGVGKTRAAKMVAEALGLPIAVISLANVDMHKLIGDYDDPGILINALTKDTAQKAANMILLIDDADRILLNEANSDLLSFILTLLESETSTFYSPYLRADVYIGHLGIVLGGKTVVTDDALLSRLHVVPFAGYEKEYKKTAVWKELFPSVLQLHEQAELALSQEDFTEEDTDAINKLVDEDTDKGFRPIKLKLMTYFEDKVLKKYFSTEKKNEENRAKLQDIPVAA